jgi:hypothetical protein
MGERRRSKGERRRRGRKKRDVPYSITQDQYA